MRTTTPASAISASSSVSSGSVFPAIAPTAGERASALRGRLGALLWLYALVPVPLLTDWIENAALVTRVRRDRDALDRLARYDGLTGLANRRTFEAAVDGECARARRSRAPLTVVYLDIDRFKAINDRFGHAAGDQVLRQLAMAIGETVRAGGDVGYRLGGDEFALVLSSSTAAHADAVVSRIRSFCAAHDARWAVGAFEFSAGIVEFDFEESASELVGRGDAAMYRQKASRRPIAA